MVLTFATSIPVSTSGLTQHFIEPWTTIDKRSESLKERKRPGPNTENFICHPSHVLM